MFERGKLKEMFNIHFTYFKANAALSNVIENKMGRGKRKRNEFINFRKLFLGMVKPIKRSYVIRY